MFEDHSFRKFLEENNYRKFDNFDVDYSSEFNQNFPNDNQINYKIYPVCSPIYFTYNFNRNINSKNYIKNKPNIDNIIYLFKTNFFQRYLVGICNKLIENILLMKLKGLKELIVKLFQI